ncbi:MAG: hypothetical protein KDB48_04410 [Solirubrobacterales bacterium]|nr:hypothetical protein [Solirubrobacterales bacterium]HMT05490.1 hypothetical protein [Solirubrobacterales bacterium]
MTVKKLGVVGEPLAQIDMSGPVRWDPDAASLSMGVDSFGVLNREVVLAVPGELGLAKIVNGRRYAASVDLDNSGVTSLAGLSANFSRASATDPAQAFGTHSR